MGKDAPSIDVNHDEDKVDGLILWILLNIVCSFFCGRVASSKGYDAVTWFFAGLFFGLIALIAAAGMHRSKEWAQSVWRCPTCDEPVRKAAKKCPHCHSGITPTA